jgi:hypothetical protein
MKRWTLVVAAGAMLVAGGVFAGCSSDEAEAPDTTVAALDTTPNSVATTSTQGVAPTTAEAMDPDAACIDCHTNQETLMALAVEPVDAESLSSGEG